LALCPAGRGLWAGIFFFFSIEISVEKEKLHYLTGRLKESSLIKKPVSAFFSFEKKLVRWGIDMGLMGKKMTTK
jgi:hypothetical protein